MIIKFTLIFLEKFENQLYFLGSFSTRITWNYVLSFLPFKFFEQKIQRIFWVYINI